MTVRTDVSAEAKRAGNKKKQALLRSAQRAAQKAVATHRNELRVLNNIKGEIRTAEAKVDKLLKKRKAHNQLVATLQHRVSKAEREVKRIRKLSPERALRERVTSLL